MTTAEIDGLRKEAKELGVKKWHLLGEEKLKIEIALAKGDTADNPPEVKPEVKAEKARSVAPRMNIQNIAGNDRQKYIDDLERDNEGYKYFFQPSSITSEQLANKGMESTSKHWKNNLVCRTSMEGFHEWQGAKRGHQRKVMDSIDVDGRFIQSATEAPKKGV